MQQQEDFVFTTGNVDEWPHTPPLAVWVRLDQEDHSLRWRVGPGHLHNLLDDALEALGALGLLGVE